jgi:hypothetical protein
MSRSDRRDFLKQSASLLAAGGIEPMPGNPTPDKTRAEFAAYQQQRRKELWSLLGELPWNHKPGPAIVMSMEKHDGYTLERLVLDLNGIEPVPALLLIPERRDPRAPGLLHIHWHAGMYELGKEQLLTGVEAQPAYAPVCAEKGLVTLGIDCWCFGERRHDEVGKRGEDDTFKYMLWNGKVLWGMMMYDEYRAMDYLASRPEVDPNRLGALGMSMGSTKAWWLAALDQRVRVCMDVCCLTDYEELIKLQSLSRHGLYYYAPSLLKHFQTAQINELIVPRAHLSVNGYLDELTPPAGVERIREHLMPLYQKYGRSEDCHIEMFECPHQELPEMRKLILQWMDTHLIQSAAS